MLATPLLFLVASALSTLTSEAHLAADVEFLSALDRTYLNTKGLNLAAQYVEGRLQSDVSAPIERQAIASPFSDVTDPQANYRNIIARASAMPGPGRVLNPHKALVLMAHYDAPFALGVRGGGVPPSTPSSPAQPSRGADDNASGVAVLLQLHRAIAMSLAAGHDLPFDVIFVATTLEEYGLNTRADGSHSPIGVAGQLEPEGGLEGSRLLYQKLAAEGLQLAGAISLETIGYYKDTANSQQLPVISGAALAVLQSLSPQFSLVAELLNLVGDTQRTGNFAGVITALAPPQMIFAQTFTKALRAAQDDPFSVSSIALPVRPGAFAGRDALRSDHAPFVLANVPGLMLTDTANFRDQCYHQTCDDPYRLDYARMAALTQLLVSAIPVLVSSL